MPRVGRDMATRLTRCLLPLAIMAHLPWPTLPEELVELIFDKLLEQYPPNLDTNESLFTLSDSRALSALTTVSLMVARRTRTHRFKFVLLPFREPKISQFFKLLASFLELSYSSRFTRRLLPISTITTHVKVVAVYSDDWDHVRINLSNDDRATTFMIRLRNEFSLEKLSWSFDWCFAPTTRFHQRFVGLLLSPTLETLCLRNFQSDPSRLEGAYIPGPTFDRLVHFGEEGGVIQLGHASEVYPSYKKLELSGSDTSFLPLPFEMYLPDGSMHRPFARVRTLRAFGGLPYFITQSVLQNNDGGLRVLRIEECFYIFGYSKQLVSFFVFRNYLIRLAVSNRASHLSMATSPVDFSRLPNLEEAIFSFYPGRYITQASLGQIRKYFLDDFLMIFGIPEHNKNPISVKKLDLRRIPLLLTPDSPRPGSTGYPSDLERYPIELANTPLIAFDMTLWGVLDAALCTRRFANLKKLRMDFVIFDIRGSRPTPPEEYEDIVNALVSPCDWLSITKRILPLTVAAGRVGLEGRITELKVMSWANENIDYSKGVCKAQYP